MCGAFERGREKCCFPVEESSEVCPSVENRGFSKDDMWRLVEHISSVWWEVVIVDEEFCDVEERMREGL